MFIDNNEARNYLMERRTSEAISAYLTEQYFKDSFLTHVDYTGGWYFDCNTDIRRAFIIKNELSQIDIEISREKNIDLWKLYFDEEKIMLKKYDSDESYTVDQYVQEYNLSHRTQNPIPQGNEEEHRKKEMYCNRLQEDGLLINTANIALIEDNFLNKYYRISDVDFFVRNELGILALDIKFKYPSRNGSYGINVGPFGMFGRLANYGFKIYNIILKNERRINCIDFINNENKIIQYAHIDTNKNYAIKSSPRRCAYFGNEEQEYREIPGNEYKKMNFNGNIIDLECPLCGNQMVKRISRYGAFLGCSSYQDNGCKGKVNL